MDTACNIEVGKDNAPADSGKPLAGAFPSVFAEHLAETSASGACWPLEKGRSLAKLCAPGVAVEVVRHWAEWTASLRILANPATAQSWSVALPALSRRRPI